MLNREKENTLFAAANTSKNSATGVSSMFADGETKVNLNFSSKNVFNGRWVDYNFFESQNFELSTKLENLEWKSMTTLIC